MLRSWQLREWWTLIKREINSAPTFQPWHLASLREFIVEVQFAEAVDKREPGNVRSLEVTRLKRECQQLMEAVIEKIRLS